MMFSNEIMEFWERFQRANGITGSFVDAWSFGDNPNLADELLALVLSGTKTGTATLQIELEIEGLNLPEVGEYSVILDGKGKPAGVIKNTSVVVKSFNEVDEEFAYTEGEDDRTLESWRREHWKYWTRLSQKLGFEMKDDLQVVCLNFKLIYSE